MTMLSWNCQGLGRAKDLVIPRLREIRQEYFPDILFLMETKHSRDDLVDVQTWLGYDRIMTVNPIGYSGGLALMWKNSVNIGFKFVDKNLVDFGVKFGKDSFFVSCVYGEPIQGNRAKVWERLSRIGAHRKEPWCIMGDFNEIRNNGEKIGGPRRGEASFQDFNDMLDIGEMVELQSCGDNLTWGGKRGDSWIRSRLDRCFGNKKWMQLFPASNQAFLDKRGSDHRPVLVRLVSSSEPFRGSFRFDRRFLNNPGVKDEIKKVWLTNHSLFEAKISDKLKRCRKALSKWKKKENLNSRDKIKQIQVALEAEQSSSFPLARRVNYLKEELIKAYKEEELYWKQKSKDRWAVKGDLNTKYYHESVKSTRAKNRIIKLMDENGQEQFSEAAKAEVANDYFKNLFRSSNETDFSELFDGFSPRVSLGMNEFLTREVTNEEVREAVFAIKPGSAPGPDGMTGMFFQKYWDTVGVQVTKEVHQFFLSGVFPVDWNYTHLCLLPKTHDPTFMTDLRPISLCSVLYKIISKIMVSRLKPFLPDIVSPTQAAFVEERLISDNILIAHEMIHALKTNDKVAKEFIAIKSDMSKAYDRVEWSYLRALLNVLGFDGVWIERVMFCVTTVTYSTLINDQPFGCIQPERGLRQGDPLSPFLFVLCTEGLIHMIEQAVGQGKLQGIQFSEEGPMIHHMLFADDSLMLCKASLSQVSELMKILQVYEKATGQKVNLDKSAITFGAKIDEISKQFLKDLTGIVKEGGTGSYLGLPECFSRSKTEMLAYIYDRLKDRLSCYFVKLLSHGGKEVLIKAVAMAMPVYAMSCFKLTKKSCENLTKAMADFWWNSMEHKRKIHWLSWTKMSLAKEQGGLGFKDIQLFNQSLLAKQAWRILNYSESLFARLFKSRYFENGNFLSAGNGPRPSYGWRSIQFGKELLQQGIRKRLGNGKSISVWVDEWIEGEVRRRPLMKNIFVDLMLKVNDLIDANNNCWKVETLRELFFEEDVDRIIKMKIVSNHDDFWVWVHNKNGSYSVKSGYWFINRLRKSELGREAEARPSLNDLKGAVWKIKTAPKIKTFFWKALSNAIPVGELLVLKGVRLDPCCQACGFNDESINHILFDCSIARQIWALANVPSPMNGFDKVSHFSNLHYVMSLLSNNNVAEEIRNMIPWIVWYLWKTRNGIIFEGKAFVAHDVVSKISEEAEFWWMAQKLEKEKEEEERKNRKMVQKRWERPCAGWLKCNIGVDFDNQNSRSGGAWVVRNEMGKVLLHSRQVFCNIDSLDEAKFQGLLWTLDSLCSHRLNRVMIAIDDDTLTKVILRPKAWPSFRAQYMEIERRLRRMEWWRMVKEERSTNRGAFLIAQSAARGGFIQSYVAIGGPFWLSQLFENEEVLYVIS